MQEQVCWSSQGESGGSRHATVVLIPYEASSGVIRKMPSTGPPANGFNENIILRSFATMQSSEIQENARIPPTN
jgi:hypothetical protein